MDRFNSQEEIEWAKGPFNDGAEARILGCGLDQCPSEDTIGRFAVRSWKAGWADADAQIAADGGPTLPMTEAKSSPKKCGCGKLLTERIGDRKLCTKCEEIDAKVNNPAAYDDFRQFEKGR